MKVAHGWSRRPGPRGSAVTLGVFDGVHRGHRSLLDATVQEARRGGLTSVALVFRNHPLTVLAPSKAPAPLTAIEERLSQLAGSGLDLAVVVPFTRALSKVPAERFVREVLARKLHAHVVVAGPDTHFGHARKGNASLLRALAPGLGFSVVQVDPVDVGGRPVSSTRVRLHVADGEMEDAARCLGRPYALTGRIVRGSGRGGRLGLHTANLDSGDLLLPPRGVYAARVRLDAHSYAAAANIGFRPTFERRRPARAVVEAHIFDPSFERYPHRRSLRGRPAAFELHRLLRPERRFAKPADLLAQIRRDIVAAGRALAASAAASV